MIEPLSTRCRNVLVDSAAHSRSPAAEASVTPSADTSRARTPTIRCAPSPTSRTRRSERPRPARSCCNSSRRSRARNRSYSPCRRCKPSRRARAGRRGLRVRRLRFAVTLRDDHRERSDGRASKGIVSWRVNHTATSAGKAGGSLGRNCFFAGAASRSALLVAYIATPRDDASSALPLARHLCVRRAHRALRVRVGRSAFARRFSRRA